MAIAAKVKFNEMHPQEKGYDYLVPDHLVGKIALDAFVVVPVQESYRFFVGRVVEIIADFDADKPYTMRHVMDVLDFSDYEKLVPRCTIPSLRTSVDGET